MINLVLFLNEQTHVLNRLSGHYQIDHYEIYSYLIRPNTTFTMSASDKILEDLWNFDKNNIQLGKGYISNDNHHL